MSIITILKENGFEKINNPYSTLSFHVFRKVKDLDEIDLNEPSWFRFIFKVKRAQDIDFENKIELYGVLALFTEQLAQDISPSLYWESEIHEDYVEHKIKFWVSYGS